MFNTRSVTTVGFAKKNVLKKTFQPFTVLLTTVMSFTSILPSWLKSNLNQKINKSINNPKTLK